MSKKENISNNAEDMNAQLNTSLLAMANEDSELIESIEEEKQKKLEERFTFKKYIKSFKVRDYTLLVLFIISIVLLSSIMIGKSMIISNLTDQSAADRWDEQGAGQVSIFLPQGLISNNSTQTSMPSGTETASVMKSADAEINAINTIRFNLVNSLNGILNSDDDDKSDDNPVVVETQEITDDNEVVINDPLLGPYTYAFSGKGTIDIASSNESFNKVSGANVIGVGGDFYLFHPMTLLSGSFIGPDDLLKDGVVLDANTAFKLFGSADIVGMEVDINNKPYFVRGVVAVNDNRMSKKAGSDGGYIFMDYEALLKDGVTSGVDTIEFVSTDPYSGYLFTFLNTTENTNLSKDDIKVVQNTGRFTPGKLLTYVLSEWGVRSMVRSPIVYPYWENIARAYEDIFAFLLVIEAILIVFIVLVVVHFISKLYKEIFIKKIND